MIHIKIFHFFFNMSNTIRNQNKYGSFASGSFQTKEKAYTLYKLYSTAALYCIGRTRRDKPLYVGVSLKKTINFDFI